MQKKERRRRRLIVDDVTAVHHQRSSGGRCTKDFLAEAEAEAAVVVVVVDSTRLVYNMTTATPCLLREPLVFGLFGSM